LRNGINLTSRRPLLGEIPPQLWWIALLAILLASGTHFATIIHARAATEELARQTEAREASLVRLDRGLETLRADLGTPDASKTIEQLVALDRSGILTTVTPSEVLSEIADVLPEEVRVTSLRLSSSPPGAELELDSVTADPHAAVAFLAGLTESPLVRRAEVLEERPLVGGEFFYRIVAELSPASAVPTKSAK
jgi:Tfp pilus assembly protein PilN